MTLAPGWYLSRNRARVGSLLESKRCGLPAAPVIAASSAGTRASPASRRGAFAGSRLATSVPQKLRTLAWSKSARDGGCHSRPDAAKRSRTAVQNGQAAIGAPQLRRLPVVHASGARQPARAQDAELAHALGRRPAAEQDVEDGAAAVAAAHDVDVHRDLGDPCRPGRTSAPAVPAGGDAPHHDAGRAMVPAGARPGDRCRPVVAGRRLCRNRWGRRCRASHPREAQDA